MSFFLPFLATSIPAHDNRPVQSETRATLLSVMTAVKNSCLRRAGVGGTSLRDEVIESSSLNGFHLTK